MQLKDWADIATIVGSTAIIGVLAQAYFIFKQIKADHERSRREKSVELLIEWTKRLGADSAFARKVVESLSEEQCRNLYNSEPVTIPAKFVSDTKHFLGLNIDDTQHVNGSIIISTEQASKLRWCVTSYLNMLESILVAWQYSVVDRVIIEKEFSYLFSVEKGHAALKHFRAAAGGESSFPAIEIFANHINEVRRKSLIEKSNVA